MSRAEETSMEACAGTREREGRAAEGGGQQGRREGAGRGKAQILRREDKLTFLGWPSASQLPQPPGEAPDQERNFPIPIC